MVSRFEFSTPNLQSCAAKQNFNIPGLRALATSTSIVYMEFQGTSSSEVIDTHNEMIFYDCDGQ